MLDDPELATWKQYAVRAWPTLVVIDPEGYVVAQHAGEARARDRPPGGGAGGRARGQGDVAPRRRAATRHPSREPTALRFPGKALALPSGNLLVSDTTRHQLVELEGDGESVVRRIGSGVRGFVDGSAEEAGFSEPQGLALLDDGFGRRRGHRERRAAPPGPRDRRGQHPRGDGTPVVAGFADVRPGAR